jgi:hypothetical protein
MKSLKIVCLALLVFFNYQALGTEEIIAAEEAPNTKQEPFISKPKAQIIILNKITAKSQLVDFKIGEIKFFGNLSVEVDKCIKNTDPIKSSNLMLIHVFDNNPDEDRSLVFAGWVDSANLAVSTVEHPVYEVIPKDCVD